MKILRHSDGGFQEALRSLTARRAFPESIEQAVREILDGVRSRGDAALVEYARKYDHAELTPDRFRVTDAELKGAAAQVSPERRAAIELAIANVTEFAKAGLPHDWTITPRPGVSLGKRFLPLDRVGAYIPGGTAPLVSTIVHTVAIAKAAGVREIVVVTPPGPTGQLLPELLFAMERAGATEVYRLGGVYGVAALAYGTKSVGKVDKIVGPGNAYVTAAKKLLYGEVALDMVAGPSEIMIIADASASAAMVAADMLSQAEHGSGHEQAVLVTTSDALLQAVGVELRRQSALRSRSVAIDKVLDAGVFLILAESLAIAAAIATDYAPEHLEIICDQPDAVAAQVKAAGAIFLGPWTPEPVGDFVAGPSHVLPTGGSAKFFSGLASDSFFRSSSIVKYDREALRREAPAIAAFAAMEGLDAHGHSAAVRNA